MKTTRKEDLAEAISETHNLSKAKSKRIVDQVFDIISDNLKNNKKTLISGFGTFETKRRNERMGFNPAKRKLSLVKEANVVQFKEASALEKKLNKGE